MNRTLHLTVMLITLCMPAAALAANDSTFSAGRTVFAASSSPGNAYVAGASVTVTGATAGDLTATGGSVTLAAPVTGDALLLGGSLSSRALIDGDLRAAGGSISVEEPVRGDFVATGFSVSDSAPVLGSVFIAAAEAQLLDGAKGPVIIYGNNVALGGTFGGDVTVIASGRVTLAASTTIAGSLSYEASESAVIPDSVAIAGGVHYTSASYLPSAGASKALAVASIGIFLFARILGTLILAGLLAGLFPRLARAVAQRAFAGRIRTTLLTMLLGFAALVATPILLLLLALTFIGIGIAALLFILYLLLVFLAFMYAGILLGSFVARRFEQRETVFWRDGVLGMFLLSIISLLPLVGMLAAFLLMMFAAGALLLLFFQFAFPHEEDSNSLV